MKESSSISSTRLWYDTRYATDGFEAQRRYPNEEMLRFLGRNLFLIPSRQRRKIRVLELGCGSCANLWVVAREGFNAYGIDLSTAAIELGDQMLNEWDVSANLKIGSMTDLPYDDDFFDVVLDVFASYCLNEGDISLCLGEVARVLKPKGKFFSYVPSKLSDVFQDNSPAEMLDPSTLRGIYREGAPFEGNHYPFRFVYPGEYKEILTNAGFEVTYLETVTRTYHQREEGFQFVVAEAMTR